MSLFCELGFAGALSFLGEWVVPSHSVYMQFIHSEEPAKKTCILLCSVLFAVLKIYVTLNFP